MPLAWKEKNIFEGRGPRPRRCSAVGQPRLKKWRHMAVPTVLLIRAAQEKPSAGAFHADSMFQARLETTTSGPPVQGRQPRSVAHGGSGGLREARSKSSCLPSQDLSELIHVRGAWPSTAVATKTAAQTCHARH